MAEQQSNTASDSSRLIVDDAFEVPLGVILEPRALRCETIHWRGRDRDIHVLEWQGRRIWGATAAMLKNLIDRLERSP